MNKLNISGSILFVEYNIGFTINILRYIIDLLNLKIIKIYWRMKYGKKSFKKS